MTNFAVPYIRFSLQTFGTFVVQYRAERRFATLYCCDLQLYIVIYEQYTVLVHILYTDRYANIRFAKIKVREKLQI